MSVFIRIKSKKNGRPLRIEQLERRWMFDGDPLTPQAEGESGPVPDFALVDVNETSTTFNQNVSPRDYLGGISGYYFGNAM